MLLGRHWAASTVQADNCFQYPEAKERGSLIGTVSTARDMMQIVDALEADKKLRYWGKYGFSLEWASGELTCI